MSSHRTPKNRTNRHRPPDTAGHRTPDTAGQDQQTLGTGHRTPLDTGHRKTGQPDTRRARDRRTPDTGHRTPPDTGDTGHRQTPHTGHRRTGPTDTGHRTLPDTGHRRTPDTTGHRRTPPDTGRHRTPGHRRTPHTGHRRTGPTDTGHRTPPDTAGQDRQTLDRWTWGHRRTPDTAGHRTPPDTAGHRTRARVRLPLSRRMKQRQCVFLTNISHPHGHMFVSAYIDTYTLHISVHFHSFLNNHTAHSAKCDASVEWPIRMHLQVMRTTCSLRCASLRITSIFYSTRISATTPIDLEINDEQSKGLLPSPLFPSGVRSRCRPTTSLSLAQSKRGDRLVRTSIQHGEAETAASLKRRTLKY